MYDESKRYFIVYNTETVLQDFEKFKKDESEKNSNYFWRIICTNKLTEYLNWYDIFFFIISESTPKVYYMFFRM